MTDINQLISDLEQLVDSGSDGRMKRATNGGGTASTEARLLHMVQSPLRRMLSLQCNPTSTRRGRQ